MTDPFGGPGRHRHDRTRGPESRGPWFPRLMLDQLRGGGPALRRGGIRPLILAALAQKPMHGYEVIQALEGESGGRWRPSAGSVYPSLQQLSDEGLVTSEEIEGRRTYTLTDAGRAAVAAAPAGRSPWSRGVDRDTLDIRSLAVQLVGAGMQVQRMGSPAAQTEARRILADARRRIYRLLAEDEEAGGDAGDPDEGPTATDPSQGTGG
jgi:DNA-binding PadR family transcriptional regulator